MRQSHSVLDHDWEQFQQAVVFYAVVRASYILRTHCDCLTTFGILELALCLFA
jgi:hypothetical protein